MTGFDLIVLLVVGVAAVGGFLRGFVQEILSLVAWGVAILAI
jgi:membrane protein required for colicin V production